VNISIDIVADLNAHDDDGLCWSTLSSAVDPSLIRCGAILVAGNARAQSAVRVIALDDDGQVHFEILPGPIVRYLQDDGRKPPA
jgi:hypothetical protein